ncbi:MAG: KamA family radical SAM protein [Desulfuromonadaceae bacterium]|nr:KamA family radical SAM protein [Desulfuromonadaceae bacterium]
MQYFNSDVISICNNTTYSECAASVSSRYPVRVSKYYASLIRQDGDAIWKQCMPDIRELEDDIQCPDPLEESSLSPVPGLIHRYPDRVVLLVSNLCPVYCRFCMRKRHVGSGDSPMGEAELKRALEYIAANRAIHDVILSGGDPLMLDDASLELVLSSLKAINHVSIIRIGTRVPVTLPERITPRLCTLLKRFHPLYINTHFNHPDEITGDSKRACGMLADGGMQLGNQTVLLKGVNDDADIMRRLMTGLLGIRVKPYYLHQMDLVRGTAHFRTSVRAGLEIVRGLRGHISGLAVPHYVIDLPGGKGKVAVLPDDVEREGDMLLLRTYTGERVEYRDLVDAT